MVLRRNIYRGVYHQKGNGIGSILSGLFRLLTPFIRRGASTALKHSVRGAAKVLKSQGVQKALKTAKKAAVKTALGAATDLVTGQNPKQNAKLNLQEAQRKIEKAINSEPKKKPFPKKNVKRRIVAPSGGPINKKSKPLF